MDIVRTKVCPLIREILDVHPFIPWIYRRFDVHPFISFIPWQIYQPWIFHGLSHVFSVSLVSLGRPASPSPMPRAVRRLMSKSWAKPLVFQCGTREKLDFTPGNGLQTPKNVWSICIHMDLPEKGKEMILMYCDFMMGKLVICAGYHGYSYSRWGYKPSYWGFQSYLSACLRRSSWIGSQG